MIKVKDLITFLKEMDSNAVVMVYDTTGMRVMPLESVVPDKYVSQDKLESRLRVTNAVNLKPGQAIARLSY